MGRRRPKALRLAIALAIAAVLGVAAGVAAHLVLRQSAGAAEMQSSELHGQANWAAGERPAPAFALRNVLGGTGSLASSRGHVTLVTFLDSKCRSLCPIVGRDLGAVQRALPSAHRPTVLVVSVDPVGDTATSVRGAIRRWRLEPGWHWLTGTRPRLADVTSQLDEYFAGERRAFDLELDLRGTELQLDVWRGLLEIPYGTTLSYSELARRAGRPDVVRAVGAAVGQTPVPIVVPCHRVIGKDGTLTGYGGGLHRKQTLLELEHLTAGVAPAAWAFRQLTLL